MDGFGGGVELRRSSHEPLVVAVVALLSTPAPRWQAQPLPRGTERAALGKEQRFFLHLPLVAMPARLQTSSGGVCSQMTLLQSQQCHG